MLDARILAVGGTQQVTRTFDLSLAGWLGFVDGRFPRGGSTANALVDPNQIDLTYGSSEAAVGVQIRPELRLGLAYRFEMIVVGGQFSTDLLAPASANQGQTATALTNVPRQSTIGVQVGAAF